MEEARQYSFVKRFRRIGSMRRVLSIVYLSLIMSVPSLAQSDVWGTNVFDRGVTLYYGVPDSDSSIIVLNCRSSDGSVTVGVQLGVTGKQGDRRQLVLSSPAGTLKLPGTTYYSELNEQLEIDVTGRTDVKTIATLLGRKGVLTIEVVGGRRATAPLDSGTAGALAIFKKQCSAAR